VERFGADVPSPAAPTVLFLLAAVMGLPHLRRVGLSRRELLVVHAVVLVGGSAVSTGVLFWMIPKTIAYFYQARVHPEWDLFLPYIPLWFSPREDAAIIGFFEGGAEVPWALWAVPLTAWLSFLIALFVCTLCLMVLLGRQWITNERLAFPLAQIPLEMVREGRRERGEHAGRLSGSRVFWVGCSIAFLANLWNTVALKVPALPSIPLGPVTIMQWRRAGPLAGLGEIHLVLWPWLIAIAYLIPKDLSFSAWFFWVVRLGLTVVGIAAGVTPQLPENYYGAQFPAPYYQGGGAVLALGLWVLWTARAHLGHVVRGLVSSTDGADKKEAMPCRLAVGGLLLSGGWMVAFCVFAGCRLVFGLVFVVLIVGYYVMWARLRAEAGLGFVLFPLEIEYAVGDMVGAGVLKPAELVTMISARWTTFFGGGFTSEVATGSALEGFKVADAAGIESRRLTMVMLGGFLLSLAVGTYLLMTTFYHRGYSNLASAPHTQVFIDGERIYYNLVSAGKPDLGAVLAFGAGAGVAIWLGLMRLRFWWWPLHPLGYIAANTWGMHFYYMPFLIGWACKSLVVRYGGLRLYRQTMPLATGLLVGDLLNSGLWAVIALGMPGRT